MNPPSSKTHSSGGRVRHDRTPATADVKKVAAATAGALLILFSGCSERSERHVTKTPDELGGTWRAALSSLGGDLPFQLEFDEIPGGSAGPQLRATIHNAEEVLVVDRTTLEGDQLLLRFEGYDSEISATWVRQADSDRLSGRWRKTTAEGNSVLEFSAVRGTQRFFPAGPDPTWDVTGAWSATFTDEDGAFPARGEFRQQGDRVTGTFRTTTGDYRFLEGQIRDERLYLSTFDGAHAFLFTARHNGDGLLHGDFYSRDSYHASFIAAPAEPGDELPDGWSQVGLTNKQGRFAFAFPDLDGKVVRQDDPRFAGKVLLVEIFGSWCPNCNDSAPLLASWQREFGDQGLQVIGLAFEITGDPVRDARFVRRFAERHGIHYPLLLAGTSDKQEAGAALPDLEAVLSFPTKVFIDRQGTVRKIHSGFDGPGTGLAHTQLVEELRGTLETLLAEPAGS
jgi:thiol-disulfide isomerase/thioredoxin